MQYKNDIEIDFSCLVITQKREVHVCCEKLERETSSNVCPEYFSERQIQHPFSATAKHILKLETLKPIVTFSAWQILTCSLHCNFIETVFWWICRL